jgi:hypothetical protein
MSLENHDPTGSENDLLALFEHDPFGMPNDSRAIFENRPDQAGFRGA